MADEPGKKHKASSFLKKSKWGKVLKEDDSVDAAKQASFKLNEDVVDFLKPSTEKSKPKIDIAIATRWPGAHEVRRADEASPLQQPTAYTKPKRRKGLAVSFVRTLPEIIGEGGDEAPDPPREIGRMKAAMSRSVSDRRPGQSSSNGDWPRSSPLNENFPRHPPPPAREDDFVPLPMRRVQTSQYELSPAMQRKQASPPNVDVEPHRPSIGRTPTGFDSADGEHTTPLDTPVESMDNRLESAMGGTSELQPPRQRPAIETHFDSQRQGQAFNSLGGVRDHLALSPSSAKSPVAQKRSEMSTSEGMAFRRASMMITIDADEEPDEPPQSTSQRDSSLASQQSNSSSIGTSVPKVLSPPDSGLSPETAITPDAPNPFADPKYIKRHSREISPAPMQQSQAPAQSLRQQRAPHEYSRGQQQGVQPQRSEQRVIPQIAPPQSQGHQRDHSRDENYMRAIQPPEGNMVPSRSAPAPGPSHNMTVPLYPPRDASRSPHLMFDSSRTGPEKQQMFTKSNGSSTSLNRFAPKSPHSPPDSRDENSPQMPYPTQSGSSQQSLSPRFQNGPPSASPQDRSPRSSLLGPGRSAQGPSPGPSPQPREGPESYFVGSRQSSKSATSTLRQEESGRPGSSGSNFSAGRPAHSPQLPAEGDSAADAAFADFAARVAHMKGVFRLTAEKELPSERCTPSMWLRSALWWYLVGKSGLEVLLQQRNPNDRRELLTQAHVDLAKAWWILADPLEPYDSIDGSPLNARAGDSPDALMLTRGLASLKNHLKTLSLSMGKNRLLPPEQSLIQGQNTRIWIDYPRFTSDAAAVLGGSVSKSILVEDARHAVDPYEMLPLSDTREYFCYGRFPVDVFLNTEDAETDRVVLPCMMTVLRGRRDYQTSVSIASQCELVSLNILPAQGERRGLTWSDVSWKASSFGMTIRLPRNFDLSVRMQERDFRAVWNLSEYARKVEKCLRPEEDEIFVHEARLAELQYADSSNPHAFPSDKVRGCSALVFERYAKHVDGSGMRKVHRGYRLLLITSPGHKTLSAVSHDVGQRTPFYFEFITDAAARGTTAMVIRIREEKRQCRILMVFPDGGTRQALYDILNGLNVGPDESIIGRMTLTSLNIEPASQSAGFSQSAHPTLQDLQWQKLGVTNSISDDPNTRIPSTVQSEKLRIVARHANGCITDRLNLGKGELLLRLPAVNAPSVQILREPQEDMTMSIDTRHSPQQVSDGIGQLLQTVLQQPTVRTFTFASVNDLHDFQTAITGYTVRFDGMASNFGISRRRMVVPIYKKWEASNVRLQVVSKDSVVQLLAFMEEFSHADAMCIQLKSTDNFEQIKGDNKNKKWGVKMVDAKFSLPAREKNDTEEVRLRQKFVNLEGLDYAEEHDDITIGFDIEQDRDRFAQALPAATSVSRGITLKRRI